MILHVAVALFGLIVGSFLNVCIRRIPAGESLVSPPSHCPACHRPIRWFDNIPVVSFLALRGACRSCGQPISLRYPLVEVLTALTALFLFWKFGPTPPFLMTFLMGCTLIVITFIDLDHQFIPDVLTLPGIPLSLAAAVLVMGVPLLDALLGLVIGGGTFYLIAFGYELVAKREGMGGGDVKLMAMLGAFFGWQSLIFIVLVSSFAGALVGLSVMLVKGKDMKYAIPFGPFLSLAAVTYIFLGESFARVMFVR